jgi:hypothetical protein
VLRRYRPVIAAALALLLAGLGHAYLRRWRRAAAWFGVILLTGMTLFALFDPPAGATILDLPPRSLIPLLAVYALSAADAYRLANAEASAASVAVDDATAPTPEESEAPACPNCGKEVDPEMAFCQWCADPLPWADADEEETEAATSR